MNHSKVFGRAFHIVWKYRALWLVGLLLVLAGGGVMGGYGGPAASGAGSDHGREFDEFDRQTWSYDLYPDLTPAEVWAIVAPVVIATGIAITALILLAFLLGIAAVFLRYVTRTSLIHMVQSYEETGEQMGFWRGLRLGWSRAAFRLFLIDLILRLPAALLTFFLVGTIVLPATMSIASGFGLGIALGIVLSLLLIPVILLSIAVNVVLGPIVEVARRACVVEGLGAWAAVQRALGLIRRHLGAVALQWLLLVGLRIAWHIVTIPVTFFLAALGLFASGMFALVVGGLATLALGWPFALLIGVAVFVPTFTMAMILVNTVLNTLATVFYSTTWTLTYRELCEMDVRTQAVGQEGTDSLRRAGLTPTDSLSPA